MTKVEEVNAQLKAKNSNNYIKLCSQQITTMLFRKLQRGN